METKQILDKLTALFPSAAIRWRAMESKTAESGVKYGLFAPYIDPRDYQKRLDAVLTPAGWASDMRPSSVGVVSSISILLDGHWVSKSDGAQFDSYHDGKGPRAKELAIKGAFSDAFKRAGVMWGIGRYLYDYKADWAEMDDQGNPKVALTLPAHMLPEDERASATGAAEAAARQAAQEQAQREAAAQAERDAQAQREAADRQAAAEAAAREAAEAAQRDAAARQAAETAQREAAERQAAQEQAQREAAERQAATEAAQRAAAEQAQRDEEARKAAAAQAASKPAANDAAVDPEKQASDARSSAIVDGALAGGAGAAPAADGAKPAKVFDGWDYSHLTLTEAEEKDIIEVLKKFKSVPSFKVLARYLTGDSFKKRMNEAGRKWLLASLEKHHNTKWDEAA